MTYSKSISSFSLFQDGAPTNDSSLLVYSLSLIARGKKELHREKSMNEVRQGVGLYNNYPLANQALKNATRRESAFKRSGAKQMNHVRGTDGWWRTMFVIEVRVIDNYLWPWLLVTVNAVLATYLKEVKGVGFSQELLEQWDTVYSLVLKTSLAFLLVFRLNRCAMRFWEARGLWGDMTHQTRNLVGGILMYCGHSMRHRDLAVRWAAAFCVATMHFIRNEHEYDPDELAGFLTADQILKMQDANHAALYAASMIRHHLSRALNDYNTESIPAAHAHAIQLNTLERFVSDLVAQVSGMEKIRSTPLPVAYVTHLRTFLMAYLLLLPYVWVGDWSWATVPLVAFTAFALFGIEGASSEVEIPFDRARPNHLALDAYCCSILDSVQGLIVHDANMSLIGETGDDDDCHDGAGRPNDDRLPESA